jgi:hypothetical protein
MPYKDPEQKRLQNRRRYLEKREEILAKNREYFIENRDSIREKQREWKRANRNRRVKDPESRKRHNARARIQGRVQRGTWPYPSVFLCTDCDEHATEYHHPNYDYPLWIEPLCSKCHLAIHGKQSINLLK